MVKCKRFSIWGGVIYVTSTGKLTVTNVTFVNSKAFLGSAIYNSGTAIVQNSTFRGYGC